MNMIEPRKMALPDLATAITTAVHAAENGARSAMDNALRAGQLLIAAKALLPHGEWEGWITSNCDIAQRTAQAYMRLAKRLPALQDTEAQRVADLPVRDAIRAIATSSISVPSATRMYRPRPDEQQRAVASLRKAASGLRQTARSVELGVIRGGQIASIKTKLAAAVDALDQIAADQIVEAKSS